MKNKIIGLSICLLMLVAALPNIPGIVIKTVNDEDIQNYNFAPGEIIIKFKSDIKIDFQTVNGVASTGLKTIDNINSIYGGLKSAEKITNIDTISPISNLYVFTFQENIDISSVINQYKKENYVDYAEPNYIDYSCDISIPPNDIYYNKQWALDQSNNCDIDAPEAWSWLIENGREIGDSDITIAVIDSGIDYNHPELFNNIWVNPDIVLDSDNDGDIDIHDLDLNNDYIISKDERNQYGSNSDVMGYDFINKDNDPMDDFGHGTHCAGIISAVGDNGIGIAGVCWNCKIMPLKYLLYDGAGKTSAFASAVYYAVDNGARIISMSVGREDVSETQKDAINYAYSHGVLLIAAAGNDNKDKKLYPAGYDNVIAVAATNNIDERASFSNYGDWVDIAAPGDDIYSTMPSTPWFYLFGNGYPMNYAYMSGTSMACPMVSGLAALLLSYNSDLNLVELKNIICNSAEWISSYNKPIGKGRINAYQALKLTSGEASLPDKPILYGISPKSVGVQYNFSVRGIDSNDPNNDLLYYLIDWGDGTNTGWKGYYSSGEEIIFYYTWYNTVNYNIRAKVKSFSSGLESDWSEPIPNLISKTRTYIKEPQTLLYKLQQFFLQILKLFFKEFPNETFINLIKTYFINV